MSTSSHRFVADERTAGALARSLTVRALRRPVVWGTMAGFALLEGVAASLVVNAHTTTRYPGELLVIGLLWAVEIALAAAPLVGLLMVLGYLANRRLFARRFPPGAELEAELTEDGLALRGPAGSSLIGYASIRTVSANPLFVTLRRHGRVDGEVLPRPLLPQEALDLLRERAGRRSASLTGPDDTQALRFRVPAGWPGHVAAAHARQLLQSPTFYVRILLALVVTGALVLGGGSPAWLALPFGYAAAQAAFTFVQTRRAVRLALPEGSVVTADFGTDRLLYRRPTAVDEVRYDDCRSLHLLGDVVALRLRSRRVVLLMPRELFPDERLAALRG